MEEGREHVEEIPRITEDVWSSVLGLELKKTENGSELSSGQRYMTAVVQITGGWKGAVSIDCPHELAQRAAASMFGVEPDAAKPDEIKDALGEIANMIGGNFKSMLPAAVQLSLPSVVEGTEYDVSVLGSQTLANIGFESEGHPFRVSVFQLDAD